MKPAGACYGGEPLGIGGAYVAQAEGALSIYWNPAGLSFSDVGGDLSVTQTSPINAINYNRFTGVAFLSGEAGWGLGVTELAPWHLVDRWLQFSMGFRLDEKNAVGVTYRRETWKNGESPINWDIGWQYRAGPLAAGVMIQDVSAKWANIRPGISYSFSKFTVALNLYDVDNRNDAFGTMVGVEFRPWDFLSLRAGEYLGNRTLGIGLAWKSLRIDWVYLGEDLGDAQHITVGYRF